MDFYEIFVRSPVNGAAQSMLSSSAGVERDVSDDELKYLIGRLDRKRVIIKSKLGIKSKAQARNLMYKSGKGYRTYRQALQPRIVDEFRRSGLAIRKLNNELARRAIIEATL